MTLAGIGGPVEYLDAHREQVWTWFVWHAWLAALPVVLGLLVALPLGWGAGQVRWLRGPVVAAAGMFYTIPSLALFVLLPPILHTRILDPVNVVVALTGYSIALLVRVVLDGLAAVPREVIAAATAMGYATPRRVWTVDLPLATPVIIAGLRVAAVSNVSLVSVSAILGVPELGQLFTNGFQQFSLDPILLGIAGCVLLAWLFDAVVLGLGRLLTPWQRTGRRS
jgi:osmoprotectant transport system permease protein